MFFNFISILSILLIVSMIGCGDDTSEILQPEVEPVASPEVIGDAPAAPRAIPAIPMWADWDETTQYQRAQRMIREARKSVGKFGGQCKAFVSNIVWEASKGAVRLPLNDTELKDRWLDDPKNPNSEHCVGRRGVLITSARRGEIVQVRWKENHVGPPNNLHTFFVVSVNEDTITVIDSNWGNDEMVREWDMNIADFNEMADSFTIYTIR